VIFFEKCFKARVIVRPEKKYGIKIKKNILKRIRNEDREEDNATSI
jgi:hypothetical protein